MEYAMNVGKVTIIFAILCVKSPYCDTSDETDTLLLETMLSSISSKR